MNGEYVLNQARVEEMTLWIADFLKRGVGPTVREFADAWEVSPQTGSTYMAELEDRGYIVRARNDRNVCISRHIIMGEKGDELIHRST